MKPQTISESEFFDLVCFELGLDPETSGTDDVIQVIVGIKQSLVDASAAYDGLVNDVNNKGFY